MAWGFSRSFGFASICWRFWRSLCSHYCQKAPLAGCAFWLVPPAMFHFLEGLCWLGGFSRSYLEPAGWLPSMTGFVPSLVVDGTLALRPLASGFYRGVMSKVGA